MLICSEKFLDIVMIDSTYRRNRFNLILVNILGISNTGKNIMLGFALLSNETVESYKYVFKNLKKAWKNRQPKNFIIDESQSIQSGELCEFYAEFLGICSIFKDPRIILCGWHIQKHFLKRFAKVKQKDSKLYNQIISLPFITCPEKFEDVVDEIFDSEDVSEKQKDYLELKLETKKLWAKCYLKFKFAGGVSTTSRIEGLHAHQKRYMTSNSSLTNLFNSFRKIEEIQVNTLKNELSRHNNNYEDQPLIILKEIEDVCTEYAFKRILPKFYKGLNIQKKS